MTLQKLLMASLISLFATGSAFANDSITSDVIPDAVNSATEALESEATEAIEDAVESTEEVQAEAKGALIQH